MKTHLKKAVSNFQRFHKRNPDRLRTLNFTPPKALTYLGDLVEVKYLSRKGFRGTFKPRVYRHDTGGGVRIYLHPDGNWLLIHGGRFRVTDWMRG